MRVEDLDERHLVREVDGADFVVSVYRGSEDADTSWSVDSHLVTGADVPEVLRWLAEELPSDREAELDPATTCWSLGVVRRPAQPTPDSDVSIAWVVGSDVLNVPLEIRSSHQQRLADEMLARRHRVTLLPEA